MRLRGGSFFQFLKIYLEFVSCLFTIFPFIWRLSNTFWLYQYGSEVLSFKVRAIIKLTDFVLGHLVIHVFGKIEILAFQKWVELHFFKFGKIKFWTFLACPKTNKIDILENVNCLILTARSWKRRAVINLAFVVVVCCFQPFCKVGLLAI